MILKNLILLIIAYQKNHENKNSKEYSIKY